MCPKSVEKARGGKCEPKPQKIIDLQTGELSLVAKQALNEIFNPNA